MINFLKLLKTGVTGFVLFFGLSLGITSVHAQELTKAEIQNQRIGRGINLGNALEAPDIGAWGVVLEEEYFELIAEKGFNSVRVPIRWSAHAMTAAPYTIHESFFQTVDWVINNSLKNGLYVVINFHHYEEIFEDPDAHRARFLAMWEQICHRYESYSDSLIFEVLNEPHGSLTIQKWNSLLAAAYQKIRTLNPDRTIMVAPADWGGVGALNQLELPAEDDNMILTVHYYSPFQFTHQDAGWVDGSEAWSGTQWTNTMAQRQAVLDDIQGVVNFSEQHNIPVYMGEFGAYSAADLQSRVRWTNYIARAFESVGFSWAYWEFCSGFGIYNPSSKTWNEGLVYALLHMPMSHANDAAFENYPGNLVANGSFEDSTRHWYVYKTKLADASFVVIDSNAVIQIQHGTDNINNLSLVNNGLKLQNSKAYRVSLTASATEARTVTLDITKGSDPWVWTSYIQPRTLTLTPEPQNFSFYFTMTAASDMNARLRLNFGGSNAGINIDSILVEDLRYTTDTSSFPLHVTAVDRSSQIPLANCEIQLNATSLITSSTGEVTFPDVPVGYHSIELSKQHYDTLIIQELSLYNEKSVTIELSKTLYKDTIKVIDQTSGNPVSGVNVFLADQQQQTGLSGEAIFEIAEGTYKLSLSKTTYQTITDAIIYVGGDTLIQVDLKKTHGDIKFYVYANEKPVKDVLLVFDTDSVYSSSTGLAKLSNVAYEQQITYNITKHGYTSASGSFFFRTDTSVNITVEKTLVNIKFTILASDDPVENAMIIIGNDTSITNSNGLAWFTEYPRNTSYDYTVTGPLASDINGTVTPAHDTSIVVTVILSAVEEYTGPSVLIYPNPAGQYLTIETPVSPQQVKIIDVQGKILMNKIGLANNKVTTLDLSHIKPGAYFIGLYFSDGTSITRELIIQQ